MGLGEVLVLALVAAGAIAVALVLLATRYRRVPPHAVLVRSGSGGTRVFREGVLAIPFLHQVEPLDVSTRTIKIERRKGKGLLTQNGDTVELDATFFIAVGGSNEEVLATVKELGTAVANDPEKFRAYVEPKIASALESLARMMYAAEMESEREHLRDKILVLVELGAGLRVADVALEGVRVVAQPTPPYR